MDQPNISPESAPPLAQADALSIAQRIFLENHPLSPTALEKALGQVLSARVDFADIYFQYAESESWSLEEGIVKGGHFSISQGVGVRAVEGEKTAYAFGDTITAEALLRLAASVKAISSQGQDRAVGVLSPARSPLLYPTENPLLGWTSEEKIALLHQVDALARAKDPRVVEVMASLGAEHEVTLIARDDGAFAADLRPLVRISVTVVTQEGTRRESGRSGAGGRAGYAELLTADVIEKVVQEATEEALLALDAAPAPAGIFPVVLGPGWPGVLLHEAVGHGLEGDFNRKGTSFYTGKIGQQVAAKGVSVVDDPTLAKRRGSVAVDDEGSAALRTALIEDGILKEYLQDRQNAALMRTRPNGHGRRESFQHAPLPRMTNTFMLPGPHSPEEIIASVEKGIYCKHFSGGQVDITNGKFVFCASQAYWIENGRITRPLKGATLIGHGPEVLQKVKMVGSDLALDPGIGTCGKDGQSVPVGVGQPTVLIEGVTFGGTAA